MEHINLADTKAHLSEIIDRVEAGESIGITRHGKLVARITPPVPVKTKIDISMLEALDKIIPMQTESAVDIIRRMRDERY